jgi:hypothetical protein
VLLIVVGIYFPAFPVQECQYVLDCRRDFLGLVGYEGTEQEAVLRQIETFIVRVAQRLIVDMVRLGSMEKLTTMWYKKEVEELPRPHCDQILQIFFIARQFLLQDHVLQDMIDIIFTA